MRTKYFYPNKDGNIEFTREELEKLLNDVYDEGFEEGSRKFMPYIDYGPMPVTPLPTIIYNTPGDTPDDTSTHIDPYWNHTKIYCTDDNSIGRITLELDTINL